ncbi:copper homeostasis CutC domain-containing protein [Gymnopilus junonius]|uniref:Copper homeostasis protein cutC homolog n=1 Tax=Gymnopilus junonius TaxID=109634 RepID=A0A9P5TS68_GYMJU|nr:copper homeostasis CutC domain-containing protein [Gymnopilus junonius]
MAIVPGTLLIEVCVDSVQSAVAAVKGGADRLEVCGNLGVGGGTTPTVGLVKAIQTVVPDVQTMVMIRPRVGDFLYSKEEVSIMLDDIRVFKELTQIRGFVVGALTKDGRVDVEVMKLIVDEILPLEICFHRAFDMTRDPVEALSDIAEIGGISRVLTSGQKPKAPEGLPTLQKLFNIRQKVVDDPMWGLTIMPGSGVNGNTLPSLLETLLPLGLREIHMSGGKWISGGMAFKKSGMGMGTDKDTEWSVWRTQEDEVRTAKEIATTMYAKFASSPAT